MEVISTIESIKKLEKSSNIHQCFRESFSDPFEVKELLKHVLSDKKSLDRIARNLYIHQNGFQKYILYTSTSGKWRIRLHVWKEKQKTPQDIHNHTFNFSSIVLTGELKNLIYSVDKLKGIVFKQLKYDINNRTNDSEIVPLNTLERLEVSKPVRLKKGCIYYQNADQIHRIDPVLFPTVTLVLQESWMRQNSTIYRTTSIPKNKVKRIHQPLEPTKVYEELSSICSLI